MTYLYPSIILLYQNLIQILMKDVRKRNDFDLMQINKFVSHMKFFNKIKESITMNKYK